jgi:hypothetical protein
MLYSEIITVSSEIHQNNTLSVCGQNAVECVNV